MGDLRREETDATGTRLRLTPGQRDELVRCAKELQNTFGSSRARAQNALRRLGLVEFINIDDSEMVRSDTYEKCRATAKGRAWLREDGK